MGTNFQFHHRLRLHRLQRGTVASAIDSTADNGRMFRICSHYSDRYLLGIGAEVVQSLYRGLSVRDGIIEVSIDIMAYQIGIVGIGIRTVTATIDITADTRTDTDGITAIDTSCDVVTAINIVDVATTDNDTGRQSCREVVWGSFRQLYVGGESILVDSAFKRT